MNKPSVILYINPQSASLMYFPAGGISAGIPAPENPYHITKLTHDSGDLTDRSLIFSVEEILRDILSSNVRINLDTVKSFLPIIIVADIVTDEELANIVAEFKQVGYSNVNYVRADRVIADYYMQQYNYNSIVTIDSDNRNLYVSISVKGYPGAIARRTFDYYGNDPRLEAYVTQIWNTVKDSLIDPVKERELPVIYEEVKKFLESTHSEIDSAVILSDGIAHGYYLSKLHDLPQQSIDTTKLKSLFVDFLAEYGITDRSNSILIMRRATIGNEFFLKTLASGFNTVEPITDVLRETLSKFITLSGDNPAFFALDRELPPFVKDSGFGDNPFHKNTTSAGDNFGRQTDQPQHQNPFTQRVHYQTGNLFDKPEPEQPVNPFGNTGQNQNPFAQESRGANNPFADSTGNSRTKVGNVDYTGGDSHFRQDLQTNKTIPDSDRDKKIISNQEPDLVKIEAKVEEVRKNIFNKQRFLKIRIEIPGCDVLKWDSVLCVDEKPMVKIHSENILKEFKRDDKLPLNPTFTLPLPKFSKSKHLRIYFKPHPNEVVGINNAYKQEPVSIDI